MPATINGFSIGTDISISISDQFGDLFPAESLGHVMEFDSESEDVELKIIPITNGGIPVYQTIWSGVRGRLMFTRTNGALSSMIIGLMTAYHEAGLIVNFGITGTVMNRDATTDEYMWVGVQWVRPRFGNFRATKEVDEQLEFRAQRLISTGGATPFLGNLPIF